ncbi:tRNA (adenosine(37)-N6)-threonylcarbamoyltransferase complex dimerization subunit type 1 TsaB [Mucilaginibacter mali]|uniref:tRNA (Adenosine(37)-N6)-threonylcarbamoyltransferase complex dimerization subunit type 1 TsaB n=1 Tax=Mucilaginibacter mali TaxID=2740462 RepID=A0A7D4UKV8_9SPHI|nr:tRNA (adenosine(37)-N6)-threonylcarbamoyltransferase complex dimerization subunit type 1 TsaB [Mucilaginibacter mali]QKJ31202.1 tRNA (adenosine(37)-N6)-threonylcarbamoyltransferase complex dimerization subunit type 1 TsaB [Mucilaginibacter mali]
MILQIETATTACSVALTQNGQLLAGKLLNQRNIHAEVITLFIDEVLATAGKTYTDLDAVAVSCGPGSYTGLRIGVSTAKGLCYALDKPLIAIETLQAMAAGMVRKLQGNYPENALFCPMIDARRMEVFTAIFDAAGDKAMPTAALIIDQDSFAGWLNNYVVYFFGDGAEKCRDTITHPNARFINDYINDAADMAPIALTKFNNREFEDVAYFEPYYLKDFIAGVKKA